MPPDRATACPPLYRPPPRICSSIHSRALHQQRHPSRGPYLPVSRPSSTTSPPRLIQTSPADVVADAEAWSAGYSSESGSDASWSGAAGKVAAIRAKIWGIYCVGCEYVFPDKWTHSKNKLSISPRALFPGSFQTLQILPKSSGLLITICIDGSPLTRCVDDQVMTSTL